jgi:hypothetical protein
MVRGASGKKLYALSLFFISFFFFFFLVGRDRRLYALSAGVYPGSGYMQHYLPQPMAKALPAKLTPCSGAAQAPRIII